MKNIKMKPFLVTIVVLVFALLILFLINRNTYIFTNQRISGDEGQSKYIELCIKQYMVDTGDIKFENLNLIDGRSLSIINNKTKWNEIVWAMQQKIVDKNNPNIIYGPWLQPGDYTPKNKKYLGYRINIYPLKKEVKAELCKKEIDCIVTIHN